MPEFITNILTGIRQWVNEKIADVNIAIEGKQDILTAGDNIEITSAGTISVTGVVASQYIANIWRGTQAEYDALQTYENNTLYVIVEQQ